MTKVTQTDSENVANKIWSIASAWQQLITNKETLKQANIHAYTNLKDTLKIFSDFKKEQQKCIK